MRISDWSSDVCSSDLWGRLFAASGQTYQPTVLHISDQSGNSGCGAAQAAMGPFYCPTDQLIYLDTSFFDELAQRYGAAGDFRPAARRGRKACVRQCSTRGSPSN